MGRKKKTLIERNLFIPTTVLYLCFLPWIEENYQEVDYLELALYNEDVTGANLKIRGIKSEVDAFVEWIVDEIKISEENLINNEVAQQMLNN